METINLKTIVTSDCYLDHISDPFMKGNFSNADYYYNCHRKYDLTVAARIKYGKT